MLNHKKTNLSSLQNSFNAYLIKEDPNFEDLTEEGPKLDKASRIKIYFDAYRLRLIEVLQEDYPKLHSALGDETFDSLSRSYIAFYPSQHFSIRYFGQHLSQFLNEQEPYNRHPYLSELAAFEWALGNSLDAKDAHIITLNDLQTLSPEDWGYLTLQFHPSVDSLLCYWDVPEIWKAIEEESAARSFSEYPNPITWIVWRKDLQGQYRSLSDEQLKMLALYKEGKCFAEICEALLEDHPEEQVPTIAFGFLHQCISDGLVSEIALSLEEDSLEEE